MTKMMVQNLSPQTTAESLTSLFSKFGIVRSVDIAKEVMTGRCGSFGYIVVDEVSPGAALHELDGKFVIDRAIRVTLETKRDLQRSLG
ncbi:MAG: hypothetical protein ACJ0SL_01365 [Candidatus Rariloculaceae bacterium]